MVVNANNGSSNFQGQTYIDFSSVAWFELLSFLFSAIHPPPLQSIPNYSQKEQLDCPPSTIVDGILKEKEEMGGIANKVSSWKEEEKFIKRRSEKSEEISQERCG